MDFTALSSTLSPLAAAALLALYAVATLIKANKDTAETFARLRGVEERLTRVEADLSWIKNTLERMEAGR